MKRKLKTWHNIIHAVTSFKQSPVFKGLLLLSCHRKFHINWTSFNTSNINITNNHFSPQVMEHRKDHEIWRWILRSVLYHLGNIYNVFNHFIWKSKCKLNVTRIYSCQVQITIKNNIYLKPQTLNYEKKVLTVMVNNSTKYQQSEKPHFTSNHWTQKRQCRWKSRFLFGTGTQIVVGLIQ